MDFSLTPEHEMTRRIVREFTEQEVAPVIKDHDRAQTVNFHALSRIAEPGILGICIPARYGGAGMDHVCLGLASVELYAYALGYREDRPQRRELPPYEV